jgi:hypothetical protein
MHPTIHTGCAARKSLDLQACCFLELKPDRLLMQAGTLLASHSAIFAAFRRRTIVSGMAQDHMDT